MGKGVARMRHAAGKDAADIGGSPSGAVPRRAAPMR